MKTKFLFVSAVIAIGTQVNAEVVRPTGMNAGEIRFKELGAQTDDFENGFNNGKWQNAPASLNVGAWTFDNDNAFVENGRLKIATTQETHTRSFQDSCWDGVAGGASQTVQRELYYKSGAVRSTVEGTYGFYEASIKGVNIFPGLSPAFWLYSDGHPFPRVQGEQYVDYSEIDIVELQQADWRSPTDFDEVNDMDHNLHARVEENGKIVWKRPKPNPDAQLLHYEAPFDPSKDFHTYAVENRPDKIIWYVDGVKVGEKVNKWWHKPMHLIFSQGLRRHLIKYNSACQRADPNPDNIIKEGFPEDATMQVEYVKTWEVLPSIWVDDVDKYTTTNYRSGSTLDVVVNYHGGSNFHVVSDKYNGITVNLVEKNAQGVVGIVASANDASVVNDNKKYSGQTTISLDLSGVMPAAELPVGHYYALAPVFKSSNGSDIFLQNAINNINIVSGSTAGVAVSGVSITGSNSRVINVGESLQLAASVQPSNASNKQLTWSSTDSSIVDVDSNGVLTGYSKGTTSIDVETVDGRFADVVSVTVNTDNSGGDSLENLVFNSSFEQNNLATSWTNSWGNVDIVNNNAKRGSNAGYIDGTGALVQIIDVQPNTTYTLSGYGKASSLTEKVRLGVKEYGGNEKSLRFKRLSYQQLSTTFTTGESNTKAKIFFWNGQKGVQAYADDIVVSKESNGGNSSEPVNVTGVSTNPARDELIVGETILLTATTSPSNAHDKTVTFNTSNPLIAVVNNAGLVTAVGEGSVRITTKTNDGGFTDATVITVTPSDDVSCDGGWVSVAGVMLSIDDNRVHVGQTANLNTVVAPVCASNKSVTYSSSNLAVATVNALGVVTARNKGEAVITVKTKNKGKTDSVTIKVD
ncbi:Ig-like domain-containing protein [Alteromonas stellipolaris]|uniref:Ig-like domain-containing protein n=1 Tax=Alteromonas stellipolaris TaxID=233316 RepID=UPI0026E36CA6|nr:Ig-like domain-containing protein [Alteromonas stellipolaris]MDO6535550.1 Ig-like domain-containing protein [Alteromonas stellipolaris]MDO6627426.1 Ig-like domain-containing protein [Alteromonas stellipolaris]